MRRRLAVDASGNLADEETPVTSHSPGPMLKAKPASRKPTPWVLQAETKRKDVAKALLAQLNHLAYDSTLTQPERNLAWRAAGRIRKPPFSSDTRYQAGLYNLTDQALLSALAELNLP